MIFGTTTHYFHQLFGEYKPFDYLCTAKIGANAPKVAVRRRLYDHTIWKT